MSDVRRFSLVDLVLFLVVLAGCQQSHQPTQKELARKQWDATRAAMRAAWSAR